ncbi:interferon-gamma-inducible lysosomal thiol reductase [Elysia marginata]|uniref:Interferon-gamma-inducible lysosomal thiol reductase n=1 Tax=Elysia marginata TaxID=1093978 RepID=A0AAV4GTN7_9GAST|nr:interferon-gamma-inducible lysosomal thiol reductase [Elysia marginata]
MPGLAAQCLPHSSSHLACCVNSFPVPIEDILKCSKSAEGNHLEHQMAVKTDALKPPHRYVPWVTVNGVHTETIEREAESNLVKLICDTYKGLKPQVCK